MPRLTCCSGHAADMSKPITSIVATNDWLSPHLIQGMDSASYVDDL